LIALVRQCVRFRELLFALTRRELDSRYRGSFLGKAWLVLQPLAFLAIYFVVFSQLFNNRMGGEDGSEALFALAMFCGLVPWIGFSETVMRGSNCVAEHGNLIKKFAFPTELLPVYLTWVSLINSLIGFAMLAVGVAIFEGHGPRMLWLFPIVWLLQGVFTIGLVYLLSAITVYVRDLTQMVPMLLTMWFFMSPIFMFAKDPTTPAVLQNVLRFNPMSYLIALYREIFVWTPERLSQVKEQIAGGEESIALPLTEPGAIPWAELGIFAGCAFSILVIGLCIFNRLKPGFPDEV